MTMEASPSASDSQTCDGNVAPEEPVEKTSENEDKATNAEDEEVIKEDTETDCFAQEVKPETTEPESQDESVHPPNVPEAESTNASESPKLEEGPSDPNTSPEKAEVEPSESQVQPANNEEALNSENPSKNATPESSNSEDGSKIATPDLLEDSIDSETDLALSASLHAADQMKKRLEEIDPCEKLRALCKKGEVKELDDFLQQRDKHEVDIDYISTDGWTCLHEIITHGCQFTDVARVLLQHGASPNTVDFSQDSPLHASLLYHNTENVQLLLKHGANTELVNAIGRKPIHNANDAENLEILLNYGADINGKDATGNTALHFAVMAKDMERIKLLVSRNCDINATNKAGSTPLHLTPDVEIARLLVEGNGKESTADVNIADNSGNSPLHVAVRGRHRDLVRLIMEKNGKNNVVNASGKSPLALAKDREMRNILQGKESSSVQGNSPALGGSAAAKKRASKQNAVPGLDSPIVLPGRDELMSPSILKRKRRNSELDERTGPKLRFSEVNDYSGVEVCPPVEKRVRSAPMYTEPTFSSDDEH